MNIFSQIKDKLRQYIDVKLKLLKLNLISQLASLMSNFMFMLICLFIFFCILLFMGFGLTEVFTDAGLTKAVSFFITIGIYLLVLIIAMAFRKGITGFFASLFIKGMTEDENSNK